MKKSMVIACIVLCAAALSACSVLSFFTGGDDTDATVNALTFADYDIYEEAADADSEDGEEEDEDAPASPVGEVQMAGSTIKDYVFFSLDFDEGTPVTARGIKIGSLAEDLAEAYDDVIPALITASDTDHITYSEFLGHFNSYDNGIRADTYDYTVAYNAVDLDGTLVSIPLLLDHLEEHGQALEDFGTIPTYSLSFYITEGVVADISIESGGLAWQVLLQTTKEQPSEEPQQETEEQSTESE
ncbi:hypothetical protein LJC56_04210 [Christensenellaceae bacterium OttesenSCG-928-K19]|nr:hypothetical protein [Christensenellaceae bacterium OttesenSCG-928-K19]